MRDDATLVELAVQGDQSAFAELYERYFDRVFDFLARMVRSEAEAADLAQDTFLRAMNSLSSLAKGGSFKSWIFTIARNTALNRIERNSRLRPIDGRSDDDDEPSFDVVDDDRFGDPGQAAEAKSLAAYVWEAAKGLDPAQYAVLDLTVRQGLDSAEIADVLGVTKNNAYVMVNRLKKSLEDAIGALVLFKSGRGSCPALDDALTKLELGEMSPEARRIIDRHSKSCPVCSEKKRTMASPFAIFAGLAMVQPALDLKAGILEGLLQAYPGTAGGQMGASNGQSGNQAIGQGANEGGSMPASEAASMAGVGSDGAAGVAASVAAPVDKDAGSKRRGLLRAVAGAAALLLIGLFSYVAVSSQSGDEEITQEPLLAIVETSTSVAATATTLAATETAVAAIEETSTAVAAIAGTETAVPTKTPPTTPVPVAPGPGQPGITNPQPQPPGPQPQVGGSPEPPITNPQPQPACVPALSISPQSVLDFGTTLTTLSFRVAGNQCSDAAGFTVSSNEDWLSVTPASGRVASGGSVAVTATVDRDAVEDGGSATIVVSGTWGSVSVPVRVSAGPVRAITPTRPALTIRHTATPTRTCRVVGGQTICQ